MTATVETMTDLARIVGAVNAVTGNAYQGGNVARLDAAASASGYDRSGGWAGFQQWRTVGRTVRRGEHGTPCLTVVTVGADPERGKRGRTAPRGFRVFHRDQTDELPAAGNVWHAPDIDRANGY